MYPFKAKATHEYHFFVFPADAVLTGSTMNNMPSATLLRHTVVISSLRSAKLMSLGELVCLWPHRRLRVNISKSPEVSQLKYVISLVLQLTKWKKEANLYKHLHLNAFGHVACFFSLDCAFQALNTASSTRLTAIHWQRCLPTFKNTHYENEPFNCTQALMDFKAAPFRATLGAGLEKTGKINSVLSRTRH